MSIIDSIKNELSTPESPAIRAKTKADHLKTSVANVYDSITQAFNQGSRMFWASTDCTPQEIADQLGPHASGIFYLHARLGELLYLVDPSSVVDGMSVVGEFTSNSDGTITVTSVPSGV